MSDGMGREPAYLSSHATNRYFIPNWGKLVVLYLIYAFLESLEIIMKLVMGGQPCLLCIFTVVNHPKLRIMAANCSG